jgi:hypothetical protein
MPTLSASVFVPLHKVCFAKESMHQSFLWRGGTVLTYTLTVYDKPGYLHIVVEGQNSRENVARYLADIAKECKARNCSSVLIEERLEGPRLGTMDVFSISSEGSQEAVGVFNKIAYVDIYAEGDTMKFAETVATNRGVPVSVFRTVADAESWLLDDSNNPK